MARGRGDQQYAPDMRYPGDQVTAPPDQQRRAASGQRAYVPAQASRGTGVALADRAADLADSAGDAAGWPAGLTGEQPVVPDEPSHPARAGTGERGPGPAGPAAGSRHDVRALPELGSLHDARP